MCLISSVFALANSFGCPHQSSTMNMDGFGRDDDGVPNPFRHSLHGIAGNLLAGLSFDDAGRDVGKQQIAPALLGNLGAGLIP